MTIYDQDYMAELEAQNKAMSGVTVPVAADQEAVPQEPVNQVSEATEMIQEQPEEVSDKEYNFKALREELAAMKEDRDKLRQEFDDRLRQVQRQPEPPRKRAIDDINPDDLVTGAQFKQIMAERESEYQMMLGELQVKSKYSDYDEVTAKYGVPLIEKEPDFAQGFMASNNKAAYLYKIGKMAMLADRPETPEPVMQATPQPSKAERIVENSKKPGTLSNPVGGSGSLSKADYFATMSDKDFYKMVQDNLAEI